MEVNWRQDIDPNDTELKDTDYVHSVESYCAIRSVTNYLVKFETIRFIGIQI